MEVQFTEEQLENLCNFLESYMITNSIEFTDRNNHIADIYCAIQFGNEFMESDDKGALKQY